MSCDQKVSDMKIECIIFFKFLMNMCVELSSL